MLTYKPLTWILLTASAMDLELLPRNYRLERSNLSVYQRRAKTPNNSIIWLTPLSPQYHKIVELRPSNHRELRRMAQPPPFP